MLLEAAGLLAESGLRLPAPVISTWRSVIRLTDFSLSTGSVGRNLDRQYFLQLLGEHVEPARRAGAGGDEGLVQIRREQGMQRAAAIWINADSVPMQAVGTRRVSLENLTSMPARTDRAPGPDPRFRRQ